MSEETITVTATEIANITVDAVAKRSNIIAAIALKSVIEVIEKATVDTTSSEMRMGAEKAIEQIAKQLRAVAEDLEKK